MPEIERRQQPQDQAADNSTEGSSGYVNDRIQQPVDYSELLGSRSSMTAESNASEENEGADLEQQSRRSNSSTGGDMSHPILNDEGASGVALARNWIRTNDDQMITEEGSQEAILMIGNFGCCRSVATPERCVWRYILTNFMQLAALWYLSWTSSYQIEQSGASNNWYLPVSIVVQWYYVSQTSLRGYLKVVTIIQLLGYIVTMATTFTSHDTPSSELKRMEQILDQSKQIIITHINCCWMYAFVIQVSFALFKLNKPMSQNVGENFKWIFRAFLCVMMLLHWVLFFSAMFEKSSSTIEAAFDFESVDHIELFYTTFNRILRIICALLTCMIFYWGLQLYRTEELRRDWLEELVEFMNQTLVTKRSTRGFNHVTILRHIVGYYLFKSYIECAGYCGYLISGAVSSGIYSLPQEIFVKLIDNSGIIVLILHVVFTLGLPVVEEVPYL